MDVQQAREHGGERHLQRYRQPADEETDRHAARHRVPRDTPQRRFAQPNRQTAPPAAVASHKTEAMADLGGIGQAACEPAAVHRVRAIRVGVRSRRLVSEMRRQASGSADGILSDGRDPPGQRADR